MDAQVVSSQKRVKELTEILKKKKEDLEKYVKNMKEAKEQARLEIEQLRKGKADLTADKY